MKKYRVLSIDGGGIRGVISAVWLEQLEKMAGTSLRNCFDLVAGTSTGSLLACAAAKGIRMSEVVGLYRDKGGDIFPGAMRRGVSRFKRLFDHGLSAPKYDGKGLEQVLRKIFSTSKFGDLSIKPTLVTSYDTLNRQSLVLKNTHALHGELNVYDVCKASCSAPTYFPAHVVRIGNAELPLIDGGVVANNPTACAIAEALCINGRKPKGERIDIGDFVVASIGTGEAIRSIPIKDAQEFGPLEWIGSEPSIVDVLFDGSTDAVDYIADKLLGEGRYFRLQCKLDTGYDDLDNADRTNINALIGVAEHFLSSGGGTRLLEQLTAQLAA